MDIFFRPFCVLADQVALALFVGLYCPLKQPKKRHFTIWIAGACVIVLLNFLVVLHFGARGYVRNAPVTLVATHLLLLCLVSEESFWQAMFNVCTMLFFGVLVHGICVWAGQLTHLEAVEILTRIPAYAAAAPGVLTFRSAYRKMRLLLSRGWAQLSGVPLLLVISYSAIYYLVDRPVARLLSVLPILTGALFYSVVWRYFNSIRAGHESEATAQLVRCQLEVMTERIEDAAAMEDRLRRARHDLRHHNRTLAAYAQQGDTEGLLRYLEQQEAYERESVELRFCENETLNNILRVYGRMAAQRGVRTDVLAQAPASLPVQEPDLVAVVANLYENAINGAVQSGKENPSLTMRLQEKAGKFVIRCENDCRAELSYEGQVPRQHWGIGMRSITVSAERYHGECSFTAEGGRFTAVVLLEI